jgi:prefoldin subunit 5
VIKEVPVEIIKEKVLNVIQEVPVEKIITKTEYVSDDTQINELLLKIQQLENTPPKIVEVIKEVNVEVPIEVIREVIREVRVEVPVEVIVEKENNDSSLKPKFDALQNTVQKLRQEILDKDKLIKEYQNTIDDIQRYQGETKAVYLKGSNLDNKLYK